MCHVRPLLKISLIPFNHFSAMLLRGMDSSEKAEKNPVFKELNGTSWKCIQLFLVSSLTYPENLRKIRSAVFSVMLLTDRQTNRQTNGQRWKYNLRHCGGNNNDNDNDNNDNDNNDNDDNNNNNNNSTHMKYHSNFQLSYDRTHHCSTQKHYCKSATK